MGATGTLACHTPTMKRGRKGWDCLWRTRGTLGRTRPSTTARSRWAVTPRVTSPRPISLLPLSAAVDTRFPKPPRPKRSSSCAAWSPDRISDSKSPIDCVRECGSGDTTNADDTKFTQNTFYYEHRFLLHLFFVLFCVWK